MFIFAVFLTFYLQRVQSAHFQNQNFVGMTFRSYYLHSELWRCFWRRSLFLILKSLCIFTIKNNKFLCLLFLFWRSFFLVQNGRRILNGRLWVVVFVFLSSFLTPTLPPNPSEPFKPSNPNPQPSNLNPQPSALSPKTLNPNKPKQTLKPSNVNPTP